MIIQRDCATTLRRIEQISELIRYSNPTRVDLPPPVSVGRRSGYYWFPTLMLLADGSLLVSAYDDLDAYSGSPMGLYSWSEDQGQTWSDPLLHRAPFSECALSLPSGDHLLLPYRLFPGENNTMYGFGSIVPYGQSQVMSDAEEVRVTGMLRPLRLQGDAANGEVLTAGFCFNGQVVTLKNNSYLITLYGRFQGGDRYSLLFAESPNGKNGTIRSVLTGDACPLPDEEGPCEAALTRLGDNRLMCVFRMDGNIADVYDVASSASTTPYGAVYSSDDGMTWDTPVPLNRPRIYNTGTAASRPPGSVQPSLARLANGTLVLSGGRPGIYLWLSPDGTGQEWIEIDLQAHHNQHCEPDEIINTLINTSSYTEVIVLPESNSDRITLLIVYDRLPLGWRPIPVNSQEQCSIWVVRATIDATHVPMSGATEPMFSL